MAKNPDDRFRTMAALAVALEACLAEEGGAPRWLAESDTASLEPVAVSPRPRAAVAGSGRRRSVPWRLLLSRGRSRAGDRRRSLRRRPDGSTSRGGSDAPAGDLNVTLKAVSDYDPLGADGEHPDLVDLATDGDPATAWTTEDYLSFDKDGVGIMLDAGRR